MVEQPVNSSNDDAQGDVLEGDDLEAGQTSNRFAKLKLLLKNKIILFGVLPVVLLVIVLLISGLALGWFSGGGADESVTDGSPSSGQAPVLSDEVAFVELQGMTIDLQTEADGERQKYLRITVVLEVADQEIADAIVPLMPKVQDVFQVYLRELRPFDIEGSAGIFRLKEELTRRVNLAVHPHQIRAVLFKELIIQ